jgi:hypothetical protein
MEPDMRNLGQAYCFRETHLVVTHPVPRIPWAWENELRAALPGETREQIIYRVVHWDIPSPLLALCLNYKDRPIGEIHLGPFEAEDFTLLHSCVQREHNDWPKMM